MGDVIIVETKTNARDAAHQIARALVEQRLAAAAQVTGPIASTYWWQGRLEQAEEWACTAKTRPDLYAPVEQAIRSLHPYDTPSIVATAVVAASQGYVDWIDAETACWSAIASDGDRPATSP